MAYYFNLKTKSIKGFKSKLKATKLLPSQKILEELMDKGFEYMEKKGLENLFELKAELKTKEKAQILAKQSKLPEKFWIVLRRELIGHHPKARKLKDFSILPKQIIEALVDSGMKTTLQMYEKISVKEHREKLCSELNMNKEDCLLLTKLTDFCRLRYVNPDFSTLLTMSKYDTIEKLKNADFRELHEHLTDLNKGKRYFRGKIALNDMELIIRDANYINSEIKIEE